MDPTTDLYLRSEGRGGGPSDIIQSFESVFNDLVQRLHSNAMANGNSNSWRLGQEPKRHPLYELLIKYSHQVTPHGDYPHTEEVLDDFNKQ